MDEGSFQAAMRDAKLSGRLAIFDVYSFSYYPAERVREAVNTRLYGVEGWRGGIANTDVARRLRENHYSHSDPFGLKGENASFGDGRRISRLDGQVWLIEEREGVYAAMFDLKSMSWEGVPEFHAALVPDTARFPHKHHVRGISMVEQKVYSQI